VTRFGLRLFIAPLAGVTAFCGGVDIQALILDLTPTVDAHRKLANVNAPQRGFHILHFAHIAVNDCQIDVREKVRDGFIANVVHVISKSHVPLMFRLQQFLTDLLQQLAMTFLQAPAVGGK
jgi:hypothetical protein